LPNPYDKESIVAPHRASSPTDDAWFFNGMAIVKVDLESVMTKRIEA